MGFYGHITNTSRTQFSFDRTYSSRYEMDTKCASDGVYAGRYVLVEYETDFSEDIYRHGYYYVDGEMYTQMDTSHGADVFAGPIAESKITIDNSNITDGTIAKIEKGKGITNVNTINRYIKITNGQTGEFVEVSQDEYLAYWEDSTPDLTNPTSMHAHIVNGVLVNKTPQMVGGMCLCAPTGYMYDQSLIVTYYMASIKEDKLVWIQINSASTTFLQNFNIDMQRYGTSRGYDSTVWQKVYTSSPDATTGSPNKGRYEKYVMIAELNTVVPTFDICADAPSVIPITPHFDANSTNIYYRFHWQPQWGIRTKAANAFLKGPKIDSHGEFDQVPTVKLTSDKVIYPSDQKTSWFGKFYNSQTDTHSSGYYSTKTQNWNNGKEDQDVEFDAAVYYNKAGFDPEKITYSHDIVDRDVHLEDKDLEQQYKIIAGSGWQDEDSIKLSPTGLSGHTYNPHDNTVEPTAQEDTQELSVMLPSLGNSMANIWDLIYGGRETNDSIRKTSQRNLDISWEDAASAPHREGLRLVNNDPEGNGFDLTDAEVNTLAGCMNSVHDLMGMIIVDNSDTVIDHSNLEAIDPNMIYYYQNDKKFRRKHETFDYTEIIYDYVIDPDVTASTYLPGYYYLDAEGTTVANDPYDKDTVYYKKIISMDPANDQYVPVAINGYKKGSYYKTPVGEWRYDASDTPTEGVQYYEFKRATQIDLNGSYEENKVYWFSQSSHKDEDGNDVIDERYFTLSDTPSADPRKRYFKIDEKENQQVTNYLEDKGLYDDTTGQYNEKPLLYLYAPNRFYYRKLNEFGEEAGDYIRENSSIEELSEYWDAETNLLKVPLIDNEGNALMDSDGNPRYRQYLMLDAKTKEQEEEIWVEQPDGSFVKEVVISGKVEIYGQYKINLLKFETGKFYFITENKDIFDEFGNATTLVGQYSLLTEKILSDHYDAQFIKDEFGNIPVFVNYYLINPVEQGSFYTAGVFWYKTPENHYVKDRNQKITKDRIYYSTLEFTPLTGKLYFPHKYYFYDENDQAYVIDDSKTMVSGRQYYERQDFYVMEDLLNIFKKGTIWNYRMGIIPASVRLAKRTTRWEMIELFGFSRTLNTINGLIVQINKLLESEDTHVRNPRTVQGAINLLQDYLTHLDELNPRQICIVDSYGRLHSSDWTTAQEFSTTNLQTSHASETNSNIFEPIQLTRRLYVPYKYYYFDGTNYVLDTEREITEGRNYFRKTENRWLLLDVNPNARKPEIVLQHQFTSVPDTTTKSDKNIPLTSSQAAGFVGNNNSNSDSIDLYTPIVDAKGHVVGKNTETITLPFGFKILKTKNSSEDRAQWSQAGGATKSQGENVTDIIADNTQDSLTIQGGNKWIRFQTDANTGRNTNSTTSPDGNNILTIAHETHNFDTASNGTENLNKEAGAANEDNINIPDWDYDIAGHIISKKDHKYTLPFGFKTISTNGRSTTDSGDNTGNPSTENVVADTTQDTLTINSGNKWVRLDTNKDSDTVTISHDIHTPVLTDKEETNINTKVENNIVDNIVIQDIEFDNAGHMTKNQKHSYILPYDFKNITIGTQSNGVSQMAVNTNTITATNTQDTTTFTTGNKWIRLAASDNKTINFAHSVEAITTTAKSDTDLDNSQEFTVQDLIFDAAGHVTANQAHKYRLPDSFKKFIIEAQSESTGELSASNGTIEADNQVDSFYIATGNKWIRLATNADTDKLTLGHLLANPTNTTGSTTLSSETTGKTFSIPVYSFDEAGHHSGTVTTTYTMPNSYGIFTGDNKESDNTTLVKSSATATFDTFAINGDSKWIQTAISADKVVISHIGPVATNHTVISNVTPKFGDTFEIKDWTFDEKGHKANSGTHTVKIPGLELSFADGSVTGGNVLVDLGYLYNTENNKGVFSKKYDFAGNLTLGTYDVITNESESLILNNTSTIAKAFAILDRKNSLLDSRVQELEAKTNPTFDQIQEEGVYILRFNIGADGKKIPEWIKLDAWTGGTY